MSILQWYGIPLPSTTVTGFAVIIIITDITIYGITTTTDTRVISSESWVYQTGEATGSCPGGRSRKDATHGAKLVLAQLGSALTGQRTHPRHAGPIRGRPGTCAQLANCMEEARCLRSSAAIAVPRGG